jgi:uncharacterized protein
MSELPVVSIRGRNDDAVIWVQAGVHGDEEQAILALKRYCHTARMQPPPLSLKVLCPANPSAYAARSRCAPEDGLDLNRSFPGSASGSITQQTAAAIWAEIQHCQGAIDIHSSSDTLIGAPHAIFQEGNTEQHRVGRAAGRASGLPILWSSKGAWLAGSLMHAAMAAGIATCLLDIGSRPPWAGTFTLDGMLTPVLTTMADVNGIGADGAPHGPTTREITDPAWVVSPEPGWIIDISEPGSLVEPGDILARVWAEDQGTEHPVYWEGPGQGLVVTVRARRDVTSGVPLVSIAGLPDGLAADSAGPART